METLEILSFLMTAAEDGEIAKKPVPLGELYATCMADVSYTTFMSVVAIGKREGLFKVRNNCVYAIQLK